VSAEHQVNGMAWLEQIEHIGGVREQDREATGRTRWNAPDIGSVSGRIVEADDAQFTGRHGNEDRLVDQQVELVALGEVHKSAHGHAAAVIVIAERQIDRSELSQAREKTEERMDSIRHVKQVPCDKNPVRLQLRDPSEDPVVPGQVAIEVEIADLHGASAGQGGMAALDAGDCWCVKAVLPGWEPAEEPIHREREAV